MAATEKVKSASGAKAAPVGELFNSRSEIESSHTSELVIALCGPIGSPLHKVARAIEGRLKKEFGYDRCETILLSSIIQEHGSPQPAPAASQGSQKFTRTKHLIQQGDKLRGDHGASILSELAISKIALNRQIEHEKSDGERVKPRRICHIIDSIKNQEELEILRLVYREMLYFVGVFAPLSSRVKSLENDGMSQKEIFELVDQDSGEELSHGQTVRKTFPQADFFLRIDADTDSQITFKVDRFLHLILGTKVITPTTSETAMYMAASASGNSACLSRQVGAALTDGNGDLISVGWNDVPRFGGGLYMADPKGDPNGDEDRRCWNLDSGTCFNDLEKKTISQLLVAQLISNNIIDKAHEKSALQIVSSDHKIGSLIEFSRAVHAEMHAIINASQASGERIRGGKLYCTTYPCHSCARHIIAAGIAEVYYIEPYRKSLATKLHSDAITENETETGKVILLPYHGVAPSRYLGLFRVPLDSRKSAGKMIQKDPKSASPRFDKTIEALPTLEALIVKGLTEKKLVRLEGPDAQKG